MDFTFTSSLKSATLVGLADALWNSVREIVSSRIESLSPKDISPFLKCLWDMVIDIVDRKVLALALPESLKIELQKYFCAMSWQIFQWISFHNNSYSLGIKFPNKFCWTPYGVVDLRKTAEVLVKDDSFGVGERYSLACVYCLEDSIRPLWDQCKLLCIQLEQLPHPDMVLFWESHLSNTARSQFVSSTPISDIDFHHCTFQYAVTIGGKVAAEYFWPKLLVPPEEVLMIVVKGIIESHLGSHYNLLVYSSDKFKADIIQFVLTAMTKDEQQQLFRTHPYAVLTSLLFWPWQHYFMEVAEQLWDHLPAREFNKILWFIVHHRVKRGLKDYDYQKLLLEFWKNSPAALKSYVTNKCARYGLLPDLLFLDGPYLENLACLLKDMSLDVKGDFIFSREGKTACKKLLCQDKTEHLELLLKECLSSKDKVLKFEFFAKNFISCGHRWKKLHHLLDKIKHETMKPKAKKRKMN